MSILDRQRQLYQEILTERLGYRVINPTGDVLVVTTPSRTHTFIELTADEDPELVSLLAVFKVPDDLDPAQVARVVNTVNARTKLSCVSISSDGDLVIRVQMLAAPPNTLPTSTTLASILPRAIRVVEITAACLCDELKFERLTTNLTLDDPATADPGET